MTADPIAAYLARGGAITKCPPGYAAYGWTPQGPIGLASDVCKPEPTRFVQRVRQAPKPKQDPEELRAIRIQSLKRGLEVQQRQAQERRAQIARDWDALKSVRKVAEKHKVCIKRMRVLLNDAGVKFQGTTKPRKTVAPPKRKIAERDAKVVAMLESGEPVQQVADKFDITERTVRRVARAANLPPRIYNGRTTDESTRRAIAAAFDAGKVKLQALADRFGVSWDVVRGAVKKYGRKE